jgi:DNA-binding response OmpR family regulator
VGIAHPQLNRAGIASPYTKEENAQVKRKKILIVDDEKDMVKGLSLRLATWGYDTVAATNAIDCFEVIKKEIPDLILLDILMPGLDGISTCAKIRSSYKIPVIMVTALDDTITKHDAGLFGAYEYVTKPVDETDLKAKIEKALAYHGREKHG